MTWFWAKSEKQKRGSDTLAMNKPRKVKDSTEKCSVITLLTGILNSIPIGLINCDVLDHGALLSTIFNFANGSLVARS